MLSSRDTQFLVNEALSLLNRLSLVQPFALNTPMVSAAAVSATAQDQINGHLTKIRRELGQRIRAFSRGLADGSNQYASPAEAQADFVILKLRFNNLLDQLDMFADVLLQRAEHNTGIWVAGLDVLAHDALHLAGNHYTAPPLVCFLERGHGAAIRRARTRLPGGDENPVGIIQVPRERMIGSGIASSLIHEVGHQGSELLELSTSLKAELQQQIQETAQPLPWELLTRWLNEILSDFWAMAHIGITATHGLLNVVSLPSYFVFRIATDGPHPFPWIRVKISIAFGRMLYPDPQWDALEQQWGSLYPTAELPPQKQAMIRQLEQTLPQFVRLVAEHRSKTIPTTLLAIFPYRQRQPDQLRALYTQWRANPKQMVAAAPSLAFAVIGQAKADGLLSAPQESKLLMRLLTGWALNRAKEYCVIHKPLQTETEHGYQSIKITGAGSNR